MTSALFDWLNVNASYFVAWGYEKLPEPSGGDIDICIHPRDYEMVAHHLELNGYTATKCPRFGDNHKHAQFTCPKKTTIDMFTTFCFPYEGKTTVLNVNPFECLLGLVWKLKTNKGYWIANPAIESLFTSLRIIGGRKDCIKRLRKFLE